MNREEFKFSLLKEFENKNSVAIFAPKFFGKTVFLKGFYDELKAKNKNILLIKFEYIFSVDDFFDTLKLEFKKTFNVDFESTKSQPNEKLEELFLFLGNYSDKLNTNLYIFIDDFDEIENIQSSKLELNTIFNDCFIKFQNIIFCLTIKNNFGVDVFSDYRSPLYNFAKIFYLPEMSIVENTNLIINLLSEYKITIDNYLIEKIINDFNGISYYIKSICRAMLLRRRENVYILDENDYNKAYNEIYEKEKYIFILQLRNLKGKKYAIKILLEIALGNNPYKLVNKEENLSRPNVSAQLNFLEKENIIIKNKQIKSKYMFIDPLLKKYVLDIYNNKE